MSKILTMIIINNYVTNERSLIKWLIKYLKQILANGLVYIYYACKMHAPINSLKTNNVKNINDLFCHIWRERGV